jgi:hypothetical protein
MQRRARRAIISTVVVALLAFPAGVAAHTNEQIASTGGMSATLPLLGTAVSITLDDVGNISAVTLTPTGSFTATRVEPHTVRFAAADGTSKISVRAKGDKLSMVAHAASLAALSGSGTWSADVFGTGSPSTVPYVIGADADGKPTITLGAITVPGGVTFEIKPPTTKTSDHEVETSARVDFAANGFMKRLKIAIEVDTDSGVATLKIELSGKDRQKLAGTLASLLGAHTWQGHLCDGTAVAVNFTVNPDGTVSFASATGGTAIVSVTGHGFKVRFDGSKARVKVRLQLRDDGTYVLRVDGKTDNCGKHDGPKPTVNTPIA